MVHHPTLWALPTAAELKAKHECPIKRAAAVTELAKGCRTLPRDVAQLRRDDLRTARFVLGRTLAELAQEVGLHFTRVHQLTQLPRAQRLAKAVAA